MPRLRSALLVLGSLALGTAGAVPARTLELWTLRGLFQFGEWAGITARPPAPGASWGGQVAGFTFARPPVEWDITVGILGVAIPLVFVFAAMLWCSSRMQDRHRRPSVASLLLACVLGGLCSGVVHRFASTWLVFRSVDLFEALGGTVIRLGGPMMSGPDGPFYGSTWADLAGNWCVYWAPRLVPVLAGACTSLLVVSILRRVPHATQCPGCGYDRRGIDPFSLCPECGAGATTHATTREAPGSPAGGHGEKG